ncbi:Mitogen-activated protein kinase 15 [Chamberlinius hualienensis]
MEEKYEEIDNEVSALYDIKKRIGKGAYGIVWEAFGKEEKKTVAVKKIFDAFRNRTDAMRTYREVVFMKEFQFHQNIIQLLNIFKAENDLDVYLIMDRMDADLHSVIEENVLKPIHKRFITYQLLCAVDCLSSFSVIHRDLKPSNVLVNANCDVRVADFGLARWTSGFKTADEQPEDGPMTDYVATRWYRAPEILLANQTYTCGVDMWSLGCILGEMLLGKALFPGTSTVNQIELIVESVLLPQMKDLDLTSQYAQTIVEKANSRQKRPFVNRLPNCDESDVEAAQLLSKLLVFQSNQRLTAQQALSHSYVNQFGPQDKTKWPTDTKPLAVTEDEAQLRLDDYRRLLYKMTEKKKKNGTADDVIEMPNDIIGSPVKQNRTQIPESRKKNCSQRQSIATNEKTALDTSSTKLNSSSVAAGLPSSHPRSILSNPQLRYHCQSPQHKSTVTSSSVSNNRIRCGRRQFGNLSNVSSLGSPKIQMQSYSQNHGTITATSFQQLRLGL